MAKAPDNCAPGDYEASAPQFRKMGKRLIRPLAFLNASVDVHLARTHGTLGVLVLVPRLSLTFWFGLTWLSGSRSTTAPGPFTRFLCGRAAELPFPIRGVYFGA
jgi:hypothetical protein